MLFKLIEQFFRSLVLIFSVQMKV